MEEAARRGGGGYADRASYGLPRVGGALENLGTAVVDALRRTLSYLDRCSSSARISWAALIA